MRIAICDDDVLMVNDIHEKVESIMSKLSINASIFNFTDGEDLLYEIENTGIFDIVFLDIEIGSANGIDIATELRNKEYVFTLVFVSQYDSYYKAAFEVQPFWFLDKPCSYEKLEKALIKATDRRFNKEETYDFSFSKVYYKVFIDDIIYFESTKRIVCLHCVDNNIYKCYNKLDKVEKELSSTNREFLRINRSLLINSSYIRKYCYDYVELYNNERLIISASRRDKIREKYVKIMYERIK